MIAALFVQDRGCYFDLPGVDPWPEARDARLPGTHQIGYRFGSDSAKPTVSKAEAIATPPDFRDALLALALHSSHGRREPVGHDAPGSLGE